jgi:hypothetical protein
MRLLSPAEAKNAKTKEREALLEKERRLAESIETKTRELLALKESSQRNLENLQANLMAKIAVLRQEMAMLEHEKQQFLSSPLVKDLERRESRLNEREAAFLASQKIVEDEIANRETRLATSEKALSVEWEALDERKANIVRQEALWEERERVVVASEAELMRKKHDTEADLGGRTRALVEKERLFSEKLAVQQHVDLALEAKRKDLERTSLEILKEQQHLESQQLALRAAIDAFKRGKV